MHIYQSKSDHSKIQFLERITHKTVPNGQKGLKKVKLDEDNLKFEYIEAAELKFIGSQSKKGKEITFAESEFKRLLSQGMFKKVVC